MFAYCGNNPVNRVDPTGESWFGWALAALVVVVAVVAVVATAGGAAAGIAAVAAVASGTAASSTAATVAAGVFIGSSVSFAASAYGAAANSRSIDEFADYGESAFVATVTGGVVGGVDAYGLTQPQCACFIAGTLVLTLDESKPIERIQVGDKVWAWDESTGDVSLKQVVETYISETTELMHIFVGGKEIVCTPTHPFYAPQKGWTDACKLRAGDILVLVNGEYVVVEKVQHELLERPIKVYNFQVEDYHTYFVSSGVLVHNRCGDSRGIPENHSPEGANRDGAFNQAKRDYGIPTSQQPERVLPNIDRRGNIVPGRVYDFGAGRLIRDDVIGHVFSDGGSIPRHFNGINNQHYFY